MENTGNPPPLPELPASAAAVAPERGARAFVRRPLAWIVAVLLLLLLVQWWDSRERIADLQRETARRLADSDSRVQEGRTLARADHETLLALQNKIGVLEARLAETQSQSVALEAMYQDIVRGRDERLLAEIEQSIAIAAQQLQLAGNVEAALIALQTAEARLGSSVQSRFLPLRRLIARDIERLKALPVSDLSGLSLKIETVVAVVDSLPLAFEHRPESRPGPAATKKAAPAPGMEPGMLEKLGREFWQELKQLVRIERIDHEDPALLSPNQAFFLRENLRLRLLSARLALLQRQSTTYRDDLRRVRELLEAYFDTQSRPVQTALATVARLAETNPALDLPGLTETLTAVRNIKLPKEVSR
jgi:uroporphyrin-3 C-methyltransferase